MAVIDILIILAFVAYAIGSGLRSRKQAGKNLNEYFLAGKTLSGRKAGISMAATQFAADTPLLVAGLIATGGVFLLWRLWIYGIAFLIMGFIFATKWRRANVITDAELAQIRYSGPGVTPLRFLKAIYYGTIINCTVMAMVLVAAMRICEVFLFWDQWLPAWAFTPLLSFVTTLDLTFGMPLEGISPYVQTTNNLISIALILLFTTLYSTTGGLRSVVATDGMQFLFAMGGMFLYALYILIDQGGFRQMVANIEALYGTEMATQLLSFSPGLGEALVPFLMIISLQWFFQMNSDGTGYLAQRMMACENDREARKAAIWFTWLQILFRSLLWLIIGVGLLAIYPFFAEQVYSDTFVAQREITFIHGINDLLPIGVKGILLAGLLGALASTIDTHLNWGASYWSNDIYGDFYCRRIRKMEASSNSLVWVARLSNILILGIAILIMFNLNSIQQAWKLSLLFGAGMGFVLIMRWLWERMNLFSELAAITTSLIAAPFILIFVKEDWAQLGVMALVSTLATLIVTLLTRPTHSDTLDAFYQRVRPQGFWKKTATRVGMDNQESKEKLKRSLVDIFLTSMGLFTLLVGIGKLLFHTSAESIVFPIVLTLIGVILVPIWAKRI